MKKLAMAVLAFIITASITFGVSVEIYQIKKGELLEKFAFSGEIKPFNETYVTSDVRGFVKDIHVDNGKRVKKGEIMIQLDSARYRNAVRQRKAILKLSRQSLKEAESEMQRSRILIRKKVINRKKFENTETMLIQAQSNLEQAKAAYELASLDLKRCSIRSMIDGFYVNRNVFEGQTVSTASVLGKVIDLSRVYIEVKVPENKIQLIKPGQKCSIQQKNIAEVSHIDLYADKTRSFLVKLLMDNEDLTFKANMFVKGDILVNHYKGVPLVPMSALLYEEGRYWVFIASDGKAVKKDVEIIARSGDKCYAKGVEAEEQLIVTGQFGLEDGVDVEIVEKKAGSSR